jgi:hypothetical protein
MGTVDSLALNVSPLWAPVEWTNHRIAVPIPRAVDPGRFVFIAIVFFKPCLAGFRIQASEIVRGLGCEFKLTSLDPP